MDSLLKLKEIEFSVYYISYTFPLFTETNILSNDSYIAQKLHHNVLATYNYSEHNGSLPGTVYECALHK